jgi:hypothetical protein
MVITLYNVKTENVFFRGDMKICHTKKFLIQKLLTENSEKEKDEGIKTEKKNTGTIRTDTDTRK